MVSSVVVLAFAAILPALVFAALAAIADFVGFWTAVLLTALAAREGAAAFALRTAEFRALAAAARVGARADVLTVLRIAPLAADFAFEPVALDDLMTFAAVFGAFLPDAVTLFFRGEDFAVRTAALLTEAERLRPDLAAADLAVADLAAPDLATVVLAVLARDLLRWAEPFARPAAVEAETLVFFWVLLEGIRGLLLCCPAVETGRISFAARRIAAAMAQGPMPAKAADGNLG